MENNSVAGDLFPEEWPIWASYVRNVVMSILVLSACVATGCGVFWVAGGLREQGLRNAGLMQVVTLPLVFGIAAASIGAMFYVDRVLRARVWRYKQTLLDQELGEISSVRPNEWHLQLETAPGCKTRLRVKSELMGTALREFLLSVARNTTSQQFQLRTAAAQVLQQTDWAAKILQSHNLSTSVNDLSERLILRRVLFSLGGFQADLAYPKEDKFTGWTICLLFGARGQLVSSLIRPHELG